MRPPTAKGTATRAISFNLRREAAPHATPRPICLYRLRFFVSISVEKPLHMRPLFPRAKEVVESCFNLRREAAPHATICARRAAFSFQRFQSQTRSRSTCDVELSTLWRMAHTVSISDEKPLHMRLHSQVVRVHSLHAVSISDE